MAKYRIFIADDHAIIRRGLRMTFERIAGVEVCQEAESGHETIRRVRLDQPDLVVLDVKFPDADGIAILRVLRAEFPELNVLIVSMYMHENVVKQAIDSGARGYVTKSDSEDALLSALAHVRRGLTFFSEELRFIVESVSAKGSYGTTDPALRGRLTAREIEVLRLLAQGNKNKQVAVALGISCRTVEAHRGHVMDKLKISSSAELIKYALRNKLID